MKDLSPKKRFALMLVAVYVISLPIISALTYIILKQNAVKSAYSMGRLRRKRTTIILKCYLHFTSRVGSVRNKGRTARRKVVTGQT